MTSHLKSFILIYILAFSTQAMSFEWQELNTNQQKILSSFEKRWEKLSNKHQRKSLKRYFKNMSIEERKDARKKLRKMDSNQRRLFLEQLSNNH